MLRALRHDLGKYIAFHVRWLPEAATPEQVRDALVNDLLQTRRGPDGVLTAQEVWGGLRERLPSGAEREALDAHMAALALLASALSDGTAEAPDLSRGRTLVLEVSALCRAWERRAREG